MKKKVVMMLLAAVLTAGSFAGCQADETAGEETQTAEAEETETPTPTETETPTPTETPEEEVEMYTLAELALRAENNKKSDKLATLAANTRVILKEKGDKWSKVEVDGQEGYVRTKFLTTDAREASDAAEKLKEAEEAAAAEKAAAEKAAAEAAAKAEEEAKAKAEAEAAAAAQAEAEAAAAAAEAAASQGEGIILGDDQAVERQEVSRENFDDCDGSGHGYTIITYSDGTQETVEY